MECNNGYIQWLLHNRILRHSVVLPMKTWDQIIQDSHLKFHWLFLTHGVLVEWGLRCIIHHGETRSQPIHYEISLLGMAASLMHGCPMHEFRSHVRAPRGTMYMVNPLLSLVITVMV